MLAPEAMLILGLMLKMAMTATIVVLASVVVERSGPFLGALIAALPTAAAAAYIVLAVEHPADFVAASALGSIVANGVGAVFALVYAMLAQRHGLAASLGGAIVAWLAGTALLGIVDWTPLRALVWTALIFTATAGAASRYRGGGASSRVRATAGDIVLRALTVALCVVAVTAASHRIGSFASGLFAVFPVAMASFFVILQPRIGGPAAAAVAANIPGPLAGLSLAFFAVHYLAQPLGVWWSYLAGLAVGIAWNALMWIIRNLSAREA